MLKEKSANPKTTPPPPAPPHDISDREQSFWAGHIHESIATGLAGG